MSNVRRYYGYKALSMVLYGLPLGVLFGINFDEYVSSPAISVSFFGYLIGMFLVLGFRQKFTNLAKKNTVTAVSAVVFVVALIMQFLATQLLLISGMSLLGCILSGRVEPVADVFYSVGYSVEGSTVRKTGAPTVPHSTAWAVAYGLQAVVNGT